MQQVPCIGDYQKEIEVGIAMLRKTMEISMKGQERLTSSQVENKSDGSPVSICDFACQMMLMKSIKDAFPNDKVYAEEDSHHDEHFLEDAMALLPEQLDFKEICAGLLKSVPNDQRVWVIDPIDGTYGFVKNGNFAIATALLIQREVVASVVGWPRHKTEFTGLPDGPLIFVSAKGHGAYAVDQNGNFHKLMNNGNAKNAIVYSAGATPFENNCNEYIIEKMKITEKIPMVSMTKGFVLASGYAKAYLRIRNYEDEYVWDIAPFELLVREAGGFSTTWDGKLIQYTENGICYNSKKGLIFSFVDEEYHKELLKAYAESYEKYFDLIK
ncbi:Inositol monophosphatase family protein [Histomonas meleagridis]|uniref:Inositol monophosphatase family protein n=1 Tax=Histomonas meleagridis TaxID=135588 RepID=UPI00355A5B8E|nr:Inositol monophosphatase family protein [Histomonas meleagridis]KAH0796771.1 Inositol monophosphatase family protein [Histomonas meleagridis]